MELFKSFKNFIAFKKDNRGSVMITVLVAFLFVSVLVAIIMSTVVVNFRMKSIDRKTKDEFYYAEKAINDIYTGLGQECSALMGLKYTYVLNHYKSGSTYNDEKSAYNEFVTEFVDGFRTTIAANKDTKLQGYIVKDTLDSAGNNTGRAKLDNSGTVVYYKSLDRTAANILTVNNKDDCKDVKCIALRGVSVVSNPASTDNAGYVSQVTTDIVIEVPLINFFNVNGRVFDYALAANEGLYFDSQESSIEANSIKGNVYGGTIPQGNFPSSLTDSSQYGGINIKGAKVNINDSEYVVSGGDININGGMLNINTDSAENSSSHIWFENLSVRGDSSNISEVSINGNLYAADDLQVDGDGATVTINGSYYGYNDGSRSMSAAEGTNSFKITTKSAKIDAKNNTDYRKSGPDGNNPASTSSAIIVNGNDVSVNMENLNTLLLLGNAYIDHETNAGVSVSTKSDGTTEAKSIKMDAAGLPESVALKGSQEILLVPTEFLKQPNPTNYVQADSDPFEVSIPDAWFGAKYLDDTTKYKIVKVKESNHSYTYAYCYLNFKDDQSKTQYVSDIFNGPSPAITETVSPTTDELKTTLLKKIDIHKSEIKIGNSATRVYAQNAVVEYLKSNGTTASSVRAVNNNVDSEVFGQYSSNLYNRYRLLDTYLDCLQYTPMNQTVNAIGFQDLKKEANELPLARFFWVWGIRKHVGGATGIGVFVSDEIAGSRLILIRNSASGVMEESDNPSATDEYDSKYGHNLAKVLEGYPNAFVIVDGRAYVPQGSTVRLNGFIASKGCISVKNNGSLQVTFDDQLLTKRIAEEQNRILEANGFNDTLLPAENPAKHYLLYYLLDSDNSYSSTSPYKIKKIGHDIKNIDATNGGIADYRLFKYVNGNVVKEVNTNYERFVYFDNWKKGQR